MNHFLFLIKWHSVHFKRQVMSLQNTEVIVFSTGGEGEQCVGHGL